MGLVFSLDEASCRAELPRAREARRSEVRPLEAVGRGSNPCSATRVSHKCRSALASRRGAFAVVGNGVLLYRFSVEELST